MTQNQRKITKEEKVIRLLEYLKQYTDENNPASIPQIERYFRAKGYTNFFGNKNTRKDMIKEMVRVINSDIKGDLLPKEEWKVFYDDFVKENTPDNEPLKSHHIVNLYYKKLFKDYEVKSIISSIEKNVNLSDEEKDNLIRKVKKNLTNNNYMKRGMTPKERAAREREDRERELRRRYIISRKMSGGDW